MLGITEMELIQFIFQSFWHFVGACIILRGVVNFILFMWSRFWRYWSIRKHGCSSAYCDVYDSFLESEKEEIV